jgi:hypothetical protein
MFSAVPPLVVLLPATLAFCIEIASPIVGLTAMFTVIVNRPVEPGFGFLDCMLASRSVIGARLWYGRYK